MRFGEGGRGYAAADHTTSSTAVLMPYLKRPDVQDRLNALAITPLTSTPEELEKFIPAEIKSGRRSSGRRHRAAVTLVRA